MSGNSRATAPATIPDPTVDPDGAASTLIEALRQTPENPILTPPEGMPQTDAGPIVVFNQTVANWPEGAHCVGVFDGQTSGEVHMTALQAARVGRELMQVAELASQARTLKGSRE